VEERKRGFLTPPNTPYSPSIAENNESRNKPPDRNLSTGLEGTNMDTVATALVRRQNQPWLGQSSFMYWAEDEEERIIFATGGYSITPFIPEKSVSFDDANKANANNLLTFQLIKQALWQCPFENEGWCFAVALMTARGLSTDLQYATLQQPYQPKTFKQYCFAWKRVALFVKETDHPCSFYGPAAIQQFYVDFVMWLQDPLNKRIAASTVKVIKTALSTLLQITFSYNPTTERTAKNLAKAWNKDHKTGARYIEMWEAANFLEWCNRNTFDFSVDPTEGQHELLQEKTLALIAFFTLLRPNELQSLKFKPDKNFRRVENGIVTYITVKSYQNRITQLFIPNVDNNLQISPRHHVEHLLKLRKAADEALFIDTKTGQQLSLYRIILALKEVLAQIGAASYGAYSFKHAAMTYLVKQNVPEKDINQAARYSSKGQQSVVGKYYACSEAQIKIFELIAQAANKRENEEKERYKDVRKKVEEIKEKRKEKLEEEIREDEKESEKPRVNKVKDIDTDSDSIDWGEGSESSDAFEEPLEKRSIKEEEPLAQAPTVRTKTVSIPPAAFIIPQAQPPDLPK
jgi:integrase